MSLDINYFRSIQGTIGLNNSKEARLEEIKTNLLAEFENSINCENNALRNGTSQKFQVIPTKRKNECIIKSKPNETFNLGDEITCYNQKWLVVEKSANNQIQSLGTIKQCNHLFRFQNFDSTIHEYWGILEKPSTTLDNGTIITSPFNKTYAYLPYNEHTKQIFIGKRLMTELIVDNDGKEIGKVYNVCDVDGKTNHYGDNRLFILSLESGSYNESADNKQDMICDYISSTHPTPSYDCEIAYYNKPELKVGGSVKTFTAVFFRTDGTVVTNVRPQWTITPIIDNTKIEQVADGSIFKLKAIDSTLIGQSFTIQCMDMLTGMYTQCVVKVVNLS